MSVENKEIIGKSGIYQIRNTVTGKIYVGSAKDLSNRKSSHFYLLGLKKHFNKHLQMSFNKYKNENFVFEILEYIEKIEDIEIFKQKLIEREQYWINKLNVCDKYSGYNIRQKAESNLGMIVSEETRRKQSEIRIGTKRSEETKIKMGIKSKAWMSLPESKLKYSELAKGEKNVMAKLTEQQVKEIKQLLKNGVKQRKIAKIYNVHFNTISNIKLGKTWTHITIDNCNDLNEVI